MEDPEPAEDVDSEDINTLAGMMQLGARYIEDQDEADDQSNIPKMEGILKELSTLVQYEAGESEPAESEDEGD